MPDILDVFSDIFTMSSLTDAISHVDYLPGRVGQLGIFESEGVPDRTIVIEEDPITLALVPRTPWGGVPIPNTTDARIARPFVIPHISMEDAIGPGEIQSVRAYAQGQTPSTSRMSVEEMRDRKLRTMQMKLQATLEYHRIGAIKGVVYDADGTTVIHNMFTEFNVAQQTLNMALGTSSTDVLGKITAAQRLSINALGSDPYTGWRALAGDTFFDQLFSHAEVVKTYLNSESNRILRDGDIVYGARAFGGVIWENYRGSVGGVNFIESDKAYLIPIGVPQLFIQKNGPADWIDRVNQMPASPNGLPVEVRSEMKPGGKGISIEAQMNPLCLCTKPRAVIQLDNGAAS